MSIEEIPPFSSRRRRFDLVRVAPAPRRGLGVFAVSPVKAGRAVGRVRGELKPADFRSHYCVDFAGAVLEPVSPYRFLNHSCDPNCEFVEWEIDENDAGGGVGKVFELWVHALRDVQSGEELTVDYGWDWRSAIPCQCGSPNCRGWICKLDELATCRANRGDPRNFCQGTVGES